MATIDNKDGQPQFPTSEWTTVHLAEQILRNARADQPAPVSLDLSELRNILLINGGLSEWTGPISAPTGHQRFLEIFKNPTPEELETKRKMHIATSLTIELDPSYQLPDRLPGEYTLRNDAREISKIVSQKPFEPSHTHLGYVGGTITAHLGSRELEVSKLVDPDNRELYIATERLNGNEVLSATLHNLGQRDVSASLSFHPKAPDRLIIQDPIFPRTAAIAFHLIAQEAIRSNQRRKKVR